MKRVSLTMPEKYEKMLNELAEKEEINRCELIRNWIREKFLQKHKMEEIENE